MWALTWRNCRGPGGNQSPSTFGFQPHSPMKMTCVGSQTRICCEIEFCMNRTEERTIVDEWNNVDESSPSSFALFKGEGLSGYLPIFKHYGRE
jgi:hypothetical protein